MSKKSKKKEVAYPEMLKLSAAAWRKVQEQQVKFARENTEAYFEAVEAALSVSEQEELSSIHTEYVKASVARQIEQAGIVAELALKAQQDAAEALGYEMPTYAEPTVQ